MGKGDHGDNCFAATIVYSEKEIVLPSVDAMPPSIRNRHCSESNGTTQPIFIFGSMPALGKSKEKGHIVNGIAKKVPLIYTVKQKEVLLEKDGESCHEKEHVEGQGAARRNLVLAILLFANLINYMDRYTIAGVLEDVKNFYDINNGAAGLLQTSFIISYMFLSPVFGYLGDRYNRKYIMASGIFFWSIVTLAGSFVPADNYWAFLFLRALVGVGEASYSTIAPSIIADTVPKKMRTKALSIFFFAIPVGSGLGYIVGSKVASAFGSWQWALRVTPFLGIICTILVLAVVAEPRRGSAEAAASHARIHRTSFLLDVLYLLKHKSFMLLSFGFTCVAFVAGALALWAPLYMHRSMQVQQVNMEADTVSLIFGVITCAAGFSGVALGSFAASRLRKVSKQADPLVCAFGLITSAPFMYFALSMSTYNSILPWVLIFIGETLLSLNWALVTDILLYIVVPTRRSTAEACQILLSHALGDAGSPYLVGVVSDAIASSFGYKHLIVEYVSLQYALYIPCFMCVLGGGFFLATALFLDRDRRETEKAIKDASSKCSNDSSSNSLITSSSQSNSQTNETNFSDTDQRLTTDSSETSSQEMSSGVAALVDTSVPKSDTKKSSINVSKTPPEVCIPHNGTASVLNEQ